MRTIFFVLFFSMAMTGNVLGQSDKIEEINERVEKNFVKRPDSAKFYLLRLLDYSDQLPDSLLARAYNKLGLSYGQLTNVDSSRYYFKKGIAKGDGNAKLLGNIYKNWAQSERNMANYEVAFKALEQAEKYYKKANFQRGIAMVHTGRGTIYNYKSKGKKAIVELQQAIAIFKKIEDRYLIFAQQELANTYTMTENHAFAKDLYEEILPKMRQNMDIRRVNYYYSLVNYGDCLFHLGEMQEAEEAYTTALRFLRDNKHKKYYYLTLGKQARVSKSIGRVEQAAARFEEAFSGSLAMHSTRLVQIAVPYLAVLDELGRDKGVLKVVRQVQADSSKLKIGEEDQIAFLNAAKRVFEKNGRYKEALRALERASFLRDSIRDVQKEIELNEIQAKYQNEYQRKENKILGQKNQLLQDKNRDQRTIIILVALLACTVIIIGVVSYKKQQQQTKLKAEALNNLERSKQNLEEKLEMEAALYEERKQTLAHKKRELVASSMEMADFKNELQSLVNELGNGSNSHRPKQKLKQLLREEDSWNYFKRKFVDVYPDFAKRLKNTFPQLTEKDIDFCALIKLNLSNKEIARLLNISHNSVISKKYRLRKKINLPADQSSLEEWMVQF